MHAPRLMAVLAHPDDESLGVGGTLAKYASEGVDVFLLTATRGDAGRYRGHCRRGRSRVHMPRRRRSHAIAFGVETVLPGVARIDVGRLSGGVSTIVFYGRRRSAAGDGMA